MVQEKLVTDRPAPEFKRVVMSLHDILSGDFFTEYIKKGEWDLDNTLLAHAIS